MPFTVRLHRHRPLIAVAASLCLAAGISAAVASVARASTSQISIVEPGAQLNANPTGTMHTLRLLGVNEIRLNLPWAVIAPGSAGYKKPAHFDATNPADYPASGWAIYDAAIRAAQAVGIGVDLDMSGKAPLWAQPGHQKLTAQGSFDPSAADYGQFVQAVGKRYSGTYKPAGSSTALPAVRFWSVWNEPDYTASLKPQGTGPHNSIPNSPRIYRGLANAAWKALGATGHGRDKIVLGELTDRGYPHIQYGGMYPLVFVQSLYCLDSHYHALHGSAAAQQGCPTSASASRRFRSQNPVLFSLSGVSVHPYSRWYAPNVERYFTCKTGLCSSLAQLGNLTGAVEKVQRAYGSHRNVPVYSTEYGYQTSPPKLSYDPKSKAFNVSLATAALYINWAEYLSYKNSEVASYDQYLLYDPAAPTPANDYGSYASGLLTWNGLVKPTFDAFLLPLFLPKTTASSGHSLEVWGDVRPARFAAQDTGARQSVNIQFAPSGSTTFTTIGHATITNGQGYFDTHVVFPRSGTVQLSYTYPASDARLAPGTTVLSRAVNVTVR